jgi:hypothetical protein
MSRILYAIGLFALASVLATAAEPIRKPYGIEKRELWTTGNLRLAEPPDPYRVEDAFPKLKFLSRSPSVLCWGQSWRRDATGKDHVPIQPT